MPLIQVDRDWFGRLTDRYFELELQMRAYRALLIEVSRANPELAKRFENRHQVAIDQEAVRLMNEQGAMTDAWVAEDDETFLQLLSQFLSERASGQ